MINSLTNHAELRAETMISRIEPYIRKSKRLIDIGSGTGIIANLLRKRGKDITPIDVDNYRWPRVLKPIVYDGVSLPFSSNSFDTALLLMVLHHTSDPSIVFTEAARVAKDIIVIETSYRNRIDKFLTVITDTIGNLQTKVNWKSYKTDTEWKKFFRKRGFTVVATKYYDDGRLGFPFLHILYNLKRK